MAERGRPRSFDREAALRAAMEVFWREGYQGASITDLTRAMGVAAPSLYAAFGDKQSLYVEALGLYGSAVASRLWRALDDAPTARQGVEAVLSHAAGALTGDDLPRGCMGVQADGDGGEALTQATRGARASMRAMLAGRIERGIEAGELPRETDVPALARFYAAIHQGMSVQARDGASAEELMGIVRQAMAAWPKAQ